MTVQGSRFLYYLSHTQSYNQCYCQGILHFKTLNVKNIPLLESNADNRGLKKAKVGTLHKISFINTHKHKHRLWFEYVCVYVFSVIFNSLFVCLWSASVLFVLSPPSLYFCLLTTQNTFWLNLNWFVLLCVKSSIQYSHIPSVSYCKLLEHHTPVSDETVWCFARWNNQTPQNISFCKVH